MHGRLLQSGPGESKNPGDFRRSQNCIGGTRPGNALFVPPPITELDVCLGELEKFFHEDNTRLPALIKAGLIHVQFETAHPFLDGNGRIGCLLVTLFLCVQGVLREPLLYLSLFLKAFPFIHEVYPAVWKKFRHWSGVKRSQMSPMAR